MADNLTFDINAKDNASAILAKVSANLGKMQKSVEATNKSLGSFKSLLGGFAITAFVGNTFRFADAMDDLSKATNIGLQSVLGFSKAIQQNGGILEDGANALNKFILTLGDAAEGGRNAQAALNQIGISLEDLRTLSEQELLAKTVQGLSQVGNTAERARLQTEIFGKSFKGIDAVGVANDLGKATSAAKDYAAAVKSAADVQQTLENTFGTLKTEVLLTLQPLTDFINKMDKEDIQAFTKAVAQLGVGLVALSGAMKAFNIVAGSLLAIIAIMKLGLKDIAGTATSAAIRWKGLSDALEKAKTAMAKLWQVIKGLGFQTKTFIILLRGLVRFLGPLALLGEVIARIFSGGEKGILDYFDMLIDKVKSFLGFKNELEEAADVAMPTPEDTSTNVTNVVDANTKLFNSIKDITQAYKEQNATTLQSLNNELRYLGMTEEQIALDKQRIAIHESFMQTLDQLGKKRQEEMSNAKPDPKVLAFIDAEIKKVQESALVTQTESAKKVKAYYAELTTLENLQKQLEDTAKAFSKAEALQDLQDELSLIGLTGEELEKQQNTLQTQKTLRQEMQKLSLDLLELENQRSKLGEAAYQKERARVIQQMNDAQELADARVKAFEEEQARKQEIENSYAEGAKRALQSIADQYKPINMAQDAIQKGWSAISSAVDEFARTGKFKFKDFARSVLADLAAMIIKAQIFKALSGALGIFGIKLPGLAEGGPAKANQPYIVGEKGPELFVPNTSGTVVPNNKMNKGMSQGAVSAPVTNNYITNNINALDAKSVAQLFAENRKTLLGSVQMAQREMPYAGR